MIGFFAKRISGPASVYLVLALFVSNVATGYLLKRAYDANVKAELECTNSKLVDALRANEAASERLAQLERERDAERQARVEATQLADRNAADRIAEMRRDHATELETLRASVAAIPTAEIECASKPVSAGVLDRMREQARSYNANRNRRADTRGPAPD